MCLFRQHYSCWLPNQVGNTVRQMDAMLYSEGSPVQFQAYAYAW